MAPMRSFIPSYGDSKKPMQETHLNDSTADHFLLKTPGKTLLIFTSRTCAVCRVAKEKLPELALNVDRLAWIDAGDNGGLVQKYEVFHLPALFLVENGVFYGAINAQLAAWDINRQIALALDAYPAELP